jgi:hypothetical protein
MKDIGTEGGYQELRRDMENERGKRVVRSTYQASQGQPWMQSDGEAGLKR